MAYELNIGLKDKYIINDLQVNLLLKDRTTKRNIIWATDNYKKYGKKYLSDCEISSDCLIGNKHEIIKPRVKKSKSEQLKRARDKAEVFTPSWVCNIQNNSVDNEWFGENNVFNFEVSCGWEVNNNKINFKEKTWQDYVNECRLEVSCGEAPYLVSRYDTVSGEYIEVFKRIGLLDRKLRVLIENIDNESEWCYWSKQALKSVYGFDWQGDNLFIARQNIIASMIEYYKFKFNQCPSEDLVSEYLEIISWNIFQMDGLNGVIPNSCTKYEENEYEFNLFGEKESPIEIECEGCKNGDIKKHNGKYVNVMDWEKNKVVKFISLIGRNL